MSLAAWMLVLASAVPSPSPGPDASRLGELARAVLSADYRGDRPELARLDAELERLPDGKLSEYRDYWRGFASWRRAMNGFNETPMPTDLAADLQTAVTRFQAALVRRPEWIEARLALVGCWGSLLFLAGQDEARRKPLLEEALPSFRWLMQNAGDNPRALWIKGGMEMYAPPPTGGDPGKAVATLELGLADAWREGLASPPAPAWEPRWGGPEILMNLAYLFSHSPKPERGVALAYARGAATAVPEWHYVREVLMPQIEALPAAAPAP